MDNHTTRSLPEQAIYARLQFAQETPSWAVYLPAELRQMMTDEGRLALHEGQGMATAAADRLRVGTRCTEGPLSPQSPQLHGRVWALSREPAGCRRVQRALEDATCDSHRDAIVKELRGHVWEALRCPHANYVLQKCIVTSRPQSVQFIIEELMRKGPGSAQQVACHRFGCRILERLLEHCLPEQVADIVNDLLSDAVALTTHLYGNYVMQHLLEFGAPETRRRASRLLADSVRDVGLNSYGSAVLLKVLAHAEQQDQVQLARALVAEPVLFTAMARGRPGSPVTKRAVQVLLPAERDVARRLLGGRQGRMAVPPGPVTAPPRRRSRMRGGAVLAAVGGG